MNRKNKTLDRVLALMLAFIMLVGLVPNSASASTISNPNKFTVTVKNSLGKNIDGAIIEYDIRVNNIYYESSSVTSIDGEAVIEDIADYATEISSTVDEVSINYTVSKDGYSEKTDTEIINDAVGNIDVIMTAVPETVTVTVIPTGEGTVKLNGTKTNSVTVNKGSNVSVELVPSTDNYIKSLMVDGVITPVTKGESYSKTISNIQTNSNISVGFVREYSIAVSSNSGGSVTLNGEIVDSKEYDENSQVSISVIPDTGYQISSVSIDGNDETISDTESFSKDISVTADTTISVVFVKVYTINVIKNENGTVITNPACTGGKVTVNTGTNVKLEATPNANFRVTKVVENGVDTVFKDNTYNNSNPYKDTYTADKDYTIEISFAPLIYSITAVACEHGSISIDNSTPNYDTSTTVQISPDEGYTVDTVKVNGIDADIETPDDTNMFIKINNITENKMIEVEFKSISSANMTDVEINYNDAIRVNTDGTLSVFRNGDTATLTTEKSGIRINGTNLLDSYKTKSISFNISSLINKIELYYKASDDLAPAWHTVQTVTSNNPIKIVVDTKEPTVAITAEEGNKNGYYNNDVSVNVKANDIEEYSGIEKVEYTIKSDGILTGNGTLYTYEAGNEIIAQYSGDLIVSSAVNNSDNVVVEIKVTDRAGNIITKNLNLKINATKPLINVSIDGTLHPEASNGYYNAQRTATVTITDRATTFDEDAAYKGITIEAKDAKGDEIVISKAAMISEWTHNGDIHTANILFSADANYKWGISYANKADLSNDGIVSEGQSVFKFAVDTKAPTGSVSIDQDTWDSLPSSPLVFSRWKKVAVSAYATGNDPTSLIKNIKYYKSNDDVALTKEDLVTKYENSEFTEDVYRISNNEQFIIYARITDYAGNTKYIGSNGIIVDMTGGVIDIIPDKSNDKGFYNSDVKVAINVDEGAVNGVAYSGIKTIDYQVVKDETATKPGTVTQSGRLYTFDITNPVKEQLKKDWKGEIVVDKSKNNSDNVKVIVTVIDNAGNEYKEEHSLSINTDKPTIEINFDNRAVNKIVEQHGYFGASRTATITIVDRASAFNEEKAREGIIINAKNAEDKSITLDMNNMISDWTHNGNTHTATIAFTEDGNYTWSIAYTNDADNSNTEVITGTSITPFDFTVDTTNPTGTITVNTNTWDQLLKTLTFGLYSNIKADITATANDATSPVTIEYYKTDKPEALKAEDLDKQNFIKYNPFSIDKDEQLVVYLKITDDAGNYIYINSDGYIVDKVVNDIVITPEADNGFYSSGTYQEDGKYGIYNKNTKIDISVTDAEPYSGIKTVDYWIIKDNDSSNPTQSGNLYTFNAKNPIQKDLTNKWENSITVDAALNNSSNGVVYIKTVDNAGNEKTESVKIDFDITAPTIDITYDNNTDNNGNTYFDSARTATIVITERTNHFNPEKATKGIKISAVDSKGENVENAFRISNWTTVEGATEDEATHTATISFEKDADYEFSIDYKDEAGNANETPDTSDSVAPYKFTVDTTNPTGTAKAVSEEGRTEEWSELNNNLTFGFWSNSRINVSGIFDDRTSPIESIMYYKLVSTSASDNTTALTAAQLDDITDWNSYKSFDVRANEQFSVYYKITDKAGNYSYISTSGLIVDDQHPIKEVIAPEITLTPQQPINGIYNGDTKVSIKVDDPLVGGTYSGLKEVSFAVFDRAVSTTVPTQEGILYLFENTNPTQGELLKTWSGEITVDSKKNNSNDIRIVVYAKDNSLNASEDYVTIKLDTTAPVIDISYDNNNVDSEKYFKDNRTATIVITERNFNPGDVKIKLTNTDGVIPSITKWTKTEGSGNQDNTKWTTTITYDKDGDYSFGIEYTDLAGNKCTSVNYAAGTIRGTEFTIDKTIPVIDVSYDNNSSKSINYYKTDRTATIVITEHNFNTERINIRLSATDDGANVVAPTVSSWSTNGDKHTATIRYNSDALYEFDIEYNDLAGNTAKDYNKEIFYIDKTMPELTITGVEDRSANNGDVAPIVSYSDTNLDNENVTITLVGANRGSVVLEGNYTDVHNGRTFTFNEFAKEKSIDDIYTLTATLTDKAGNMSTQTIIFSVNRFGSTYALSESTTELNGTFIKVPIDVVISEYNTNECKNIKITLFKNDQTIVLKEGTDYKADVEGGNGKWFLYTYTILKKNFEDDGIYRLTIHSEDAAGNVAENTLDTKNTEISFGIDKTNPNNTVANLESRRTYPLDKLSVIMSVTDNLKLTSIVVYLDGSVYKKWNEEEIGKITADNIDFTFDIDGDSTKAHNVKIVSIDAAGNEGITEIEDFYVTTNMWVRYYNNSLLFYGSIGGILLITIGLIVLLTIKKKKHNEEAGE